MEPIEETPLIGLGESEEVVYRVAKNCTFFSKPHLWNRSR